jgi:crotonobetainyl-CoA:carnitine CoA-transferase CaiB-like acyl-CoA transferase
VPRPLDGVRILDFTHGVAGPYAAMILADLGADVIKVEKPGRGDATRYLNVSKKFMGDIPRSGGDYFLAINRNKRAVTIDLKHAEGVRVALALASTCHAVMQSFRPGVLDRIGLGYDAVRGVRPDVVYGSVSGYGSRGPLAGHPGMDVVVQARAGVLGITGYPGSPPVKPGVSLADFSGGAHMAIAMLGALIQQQRTGEGQYVEVSLLDATVSMLSNYCVAVLDGDEEVQPMGSGHPQLVPFQAFETSDGHVVIGTGTNKLFGVLCELIGRPDLAADERYRSNHLRVQHRDTLIAALTEITRTRTTAEWIDALVEAGIPCAPVNSLAQAMREPQLAANEMIVEVPHPVYDRIHLTGVPYKLSAASCGIRRPPPMLGEHTDEVLSRLPGYDQATIDRLRAEGVV